MKDSDLMPFGKHKDEKLGDVPASYLLWAYSEPDLMRRYPGLKDYIESGKAHLEAEAKREER